MDTSEHTYRAVSKGQRTPGSQCFAYNCFNYSNSARW